MAQASTARQTGDIESDLDPLVCLTENEWSGYDTRWFEKRAERGESGLTRDALTSSKRLRSRSLFSSPRSDGISSLSFSRDELAYKGDPHASVILFSRRLIVPYKRRILCLLPHL